MQEPIARLRAAGEDGPSEQEWRAALRCVLRLPREMMRLTLATWATAGPFVCLLMWAFGFEAWISADRMFGVS